MKTKISRFPALSLAAMAMLAILNAPTTTAFAQGSLTPPGAPATTMKTLAQLEPRTPISSAPFTISVSGSYYLTTNLTVSGGDAITIATNNVTLDLCGFTIASTTPSATGYGIRLNSGLSDITILNGHIRGGVTNSASGYNGPGFQYGISYYPYPSGNIPSNTRIAGVSVSGCLLFGINLATGDSLVVESCTARTVGISGIVASTIKSSVAVDCGGNAISGYQVSDSRGICSGSGTGLYAYTGQNCQGFSESGTGLSALTALNCYGGSNSGSYGLYANTAQNCYGFHGGSGIALRAVDMAIGCTGNSSSGVGLQAYIANSCRVAGGTASITYKYNMP